MKLIGLMSAAAVAAVALVSVPAVAGPHHGPHWKTVCKTVFHHGHKSRDCRKVRVW
jgi:hypothetical protein